MEKTYTTRNRHREDNLTTTEGILKVLTRIYWMKKEGKPYSVTSICEDCKVMHLNKAIVENLYDWSYLPTWELADKCRQAYYRNAETWPCRQKKEVVSEVSGARNPAQKAEQMIISFDYGSGEDKSAIIEIWGHRFQITRLD